MLYEVITIFRRRGQRRCRIGELLDQEIEKGLSDTTETIVLNVLLEVHGDDVVLLQKGELVVEDAVGNAVSVSYNFV